MNLRTPTSPLLAVTAALSMAACTTNGGMPPMPFAQDSLPASVQVPTGHQVAFETAAAGEVTYECRAKKNMASEFEWVFVSPKAELKSRTGEKLGTYYGPPATWDFNDGAKVSGAQQSVAPNGIGNLPLQLVKAQPAVGNGMAQGVSYVQRVATWGGVAPAMPCNASNMGSQQVVTYSADYIFWKPV